MDGNAGKLAERALQYPALAYDQARQSTIELKNSAAALSPSEERK